MKVIVLALFFISGCVVGVDGALAQCACPHPNITAFEEFKKSEAVFIGEVLGSDIVENPAHKTRGDVYDMEIKFKVKKVWRKSLQETVSVRFLVYGCIRKFDKGSEHLVYAFNDNKRRLRMYCCCTRSRPLGDAAEDVKEFKERGEEAKPIIMNQSRGVGVPSSQNIPVSTSQSYKPKNGYVPDEQTAISIAVAVWIPIYGKEKIEGEKPYKATLKNGVWTVTGSLPEGYVGGTAEAQISQDSGCILRIIHYQ